LKLFILCIPRTGAGTVNARRSFLLGFSIGMTAKDRHDITGMLAAWNDGSAEALDRVIEVFYRNCGDRSWRCARR
jgi:hypothetical protein